MAYVIRARPWGITSNAVDQWTPTLTIHDPDPQAMALEEQLGSRNSAFLPSIGLLFDAAGPLPEILAIMAPMLVPARRRV